MLLKAYNCKLKNGNYFNIWGDGKSLREFLYVDDLAEMTILIMQNYTKIKKTVINIGSGNEISIDDLAKKIINIIGIKVKLSYDNSKPNGIRSKIIDSSFIKSLGWQPKVNLDEGIQLTYKDLSTNFNK